MIVIAWGQFELHQVGNDRYLAGKEFQIIPGGTMFEASNVLHGLIGYNAVLTDGNEYAMGAQIILCGLRGTKTECLADAENEIVTAFISQEVTAEY